MPFSWSSYSVPAKPWATSLTMHISQHWSSNTASENYGPPIETSLASPDCASTILSLRETEHLLPITPAIQTPLN